MPEPTVSEIKESLRERLVDSYQDAYEDAKDTWKTLEGKAQVVSTVSGVFLAAAFAFAREATLSSAEKCLLAISAVLLAAAVGVCIYALELASFPQPPYGDFANRVISDILAKKDDTEVREYADALDPYLASSWQLTLKKLFDLNTDKAAAVRIAQTMLGFAIITVATLTVLKIVNME